MQRPFPLWPCLLAAPLVLALASCTTAPKPVQGPDGSFVLECEGELSYCVGQAETFCGNERMVILEATSREGRHGDARYADGSDIALVRFACGRGLAVDLHLRKRHTPRGAPPAPATPAPVAAATRACTPGATQQCIGPGACAGGQACVPDGSGFGPCDCGGPASPTPPPPPPSAE